MTYAFRPDAGSDDGARLRAEIERRAKVTPAMLHSIDEDGRLIAVSDAWLDKLGYAREEVLGRLSSDFLTAESQKRAVEQIVPAFFKIGRVDDVEYQMVRKDGAIIDVLMSGVVDEHASEHGRISLAVTTDVTALKAAERRLSQSEAQYRSLVEDQEEMVSLASPEGELRFVNHAYARLHGAVPADLVGRSLFDFVPPEARAGLAGHLQRLRAEGGVFENENQIVLPDGRARWMGWTNRALTDGRGLVVAIHSVGRDIEQRVVAEQRLKESEAGYRLLADHSTDMVFQLDRDLARKYVSPACREILGHEPEEMIGVKPVSMVHPDDAARLALAFQALLDGGVERSSIINRILHRDGRWIWVEVQLRAIRDARTGEISGIIGALRDISARKAVEDQLAEANRRLETLAGQDALTGLANRRFFDAALSLEAKRARREKTTVSLLMIDVDRFKSFNDRYGHPAGDECLRRVSGAIVASIRRPGDSAARYGGEEFSVLLPNTDEAGAAIIAEKIRRALARMAIKHADGARGLVTISIGVASSTQADGEAIADRLLKLADETLYRAKREGRNLVLRASSDGASRESAA